MDEASSLLPVGEGTLMDRGSASSATRLRPAARQRLETSPRVRCAI